MMIKLSYLTCTFLSLPLPNNDAALLVWNDGGDLDMWLGRHC